MNILYVLQGLDFYNGCTQARNMLPALELSKRGHQVNFCLVGSTLESQALLEADVIIFCRTYQINITPAIEFLKQNNKKFVYETDDDLEKLDETNPTLEAISKTLPIIQNLGKGSSLITTTTPYLAQALEKRYGQKIVVIPNALDFSQYKVEPKSDRLRIGWSGGCTHSVDLLLIIDVLIELQKKYDFEFHFQGFVMTPLDAQEFAWRKTLELAGDQAIQHHYIAKSLELLDKLKQLKSFVFTPFYPAEMHPKVLSSLKLDIGLCPLVDSEFNRSKSCNKFYEYATVGAATIASNVIPYNTEVCYLAENAFDDWYKKLEILIIDAELRKSLAKEQGEWVVVNRNIEKTAELWEKAFQKVTNGGK